MFLDKNVSSPRLAKLASERGLCIQQWKALNIDISAGEATDRDWLNRARKVGYVAVTIDQFRQPPERKAMHDEVSSGLLIVQLSGACRDLATELEMIEEGYKRCLEHHRVYGTGALVRVRLQQAKGGRSVVKVDLKHPPSVKRLKKVPAAYRIEWES